MAFYEVFWVMAQLVRAWVGGLVGSWIDLLKSG